jgi:hypothetical protein
MKGPDLRKRGIGCVLALTIGIVLVSVTSVLTVMLDNTTLAVTDDWGSALLMVGLVAAPFGLLAISGVTRRRPWFVAGALTLAFWALVWADVAIRPGAGGANIGLGLLMLLSPVVITLGALFSDRGARAD